MPRLVGRVAPLTLLLNAVDRSAADLHGLFMSGDRSVCGREGCEQSNEVVRAVTGRSGQLRLRGRDEREQRSADPASPSAPRFALFVVLVAWYVFIAASSVLVTSR